MAGLELLGGAIFLAASVLGFWVALPKDGQVRHFLRNDHVQSYYAVALEAAFVFGILNLVLGTVQLFK